jgi:hypothetical protein
VPAARSCGRITCRGQEQGSHSGDKDSPTAKQKSPTAVPRPHRTGRELKTEVTDKLMKIEAQKQALPARCYILSGYLSLKTSHRSGIDELQLLQRTKARKANTMNAKMKECELTDPRAAETTLSHALSRQQHSQSGGCPPQATPAAPHPWRGTARKSGRCNPDSVQEPLPVLSVGTSKKRPPGDS